MHLPAKMEIVMGCVICIKPHGELSETMEKQSTILKYALYVIDTALLETKTISTLDIFASYCHAQSGQHLLNIHWVPTSLKGMPGSLNLN